VDIAFEDQMEYLLAAHVFDWADTYFTSTVNYIDSSVSRLVVLEVRVATAPEPLQAVHDDCMAQP
jgi:hypothetical protein